MKLVRLLIPSLAAALSACAYEVGFDPEYVTEDTPSYVAEAEIVVLMHPHDTERVFQGNPSTEVGSFTTLTVPIGNIMQEITAEVFQTCFAYGVVFTQELTSDMAYIVAIEPEIMNFSYGYDRVPLDPTGPDEMPRSLTTPQVEFDLSVRAYNSAGETMLERTYSSGLVSGERYEVTNRPYERINETFHGALQEIMLRVADDIRPLLVGQCEITDFAS
ncbi:MAG: hypothetical protein OEQ25_06790 [Gammaproteobacteria bacterium]|nr:hypothetical protein [Gammaproteobacteria bacterium]MDH3506832.1 hypothetical protein [Gammaproteobacteria bacterium]